MNEQNSPDLSSDTETDIPDRSNEAPTKNLQEQHVNLKLEVEKIYRQVERLRSWLQTLVSGLLVSILIAIGVASWFSYRLLLEEKRANQETQQTLEIQTEMLERLEILEEKIVSQERQIRQNREQISQDLNSLIEENRQQLQQLREQLEKVKADKQTKAE